MSDADRVDRLCTLFAEVLEVERVTADTDFFVAGGHSLSALTLSVAAEQAFGVRVRVRDVVEATTPARLADRLAQAQVSAAAASPPSADAQPEARDHPGAEVSDAVRWLWLERQRDGSTSGAYTVACLFDGDGAVDPERLADALSTVARDHPVLRTVFVESMGAPRAVVTDHGPVLEVLDKRPTGASPIASSVDERIAVPFDLQHGPLVRVTLFLCAGGRWSLLLLADHLVCDGRSLEIIAANLIAAYSGRPHRDRHRVALTTHTTEPGETLAQWRQLLLPPPMTLPLPVQGPRDQPVGLRTATAVAELDADELYSVTRLGSRHRAGPFVPLAAAVARTLAQLTGSTDICLGTAVDRRARLGALDAIGFYIATVPLRLQVREHVTQAELVGHVAQRTTDVVDRSDVAFDALVAALDPPRPPGRTPFFDVWVALFPRVDTGPRPTDGISLQGGPLPTVATMFELSFQFVEHQHGLRLVLQYDALRYAADTAERMIVRVRENLSWLLGGAEPAPLPKAPVFSGFSFDA